MTEEQWQAERRRLVHHAREHMRGAPPKGETVPERRARKLSKFGLPPATPLSVLQQRKEQWEREQGRGAQEPAEQADRAAGPEPAAPSAG